MYCTKADILEQLDEDILVQLTDDNDTGSADDAVIQRAIDDAAAEIDAYCGMRYPVPFDPVPAIIRKVCVEMSICNLYARRQGVPEDRKARYDAAVRFLRDVARQVVTLGAQDPDSPPADANRPRITSNGRLFTRSDLEDF